MGHTHKGHRCRFCGKTFRKSDYRRQHEDSVHATAIKKEQWRSRQRRQMTTNINSFARFLALEPHP